MNVDTNKISLLNQISIEVTLETFAGGNFQEKCSGNKKARVQNTMH